MLDSIYTTSLVNALEAEIEAAKQAKPLKLHNLIRREGGLYVCTSPLKLDGEGIMPIDGKDYPVSLSSMSGIVSISGLEECVSESFNETLFFQDQTSLLKKVKDEFKAFKPTELVKKLFEENHAVLCKEVKNENLNDAQCKTVGYGLSNDHLLVVGPPGTGKTKTILALIDELLKMNLRVLVASHANMAVENVFESLVKQRAFGEEELIVSIRTDLPSLKPYSPKSLSDERARSIKDELDMLEPAMPKLADMKRELLNLINPADQTIASHQATISINQRQIRMFESDLHALRIEKAALEKRVEKLNGSGFLASLSHLVSMDKKEELISQVNLLNNKITTRENELADLVKKSQEFESLANKEAEKILETKEKLLKVEKDAKLCKDRINNLKALLAEVINQDVFKDAKIAGVTLMSAATNKRIINAKFDVLIVDEASMANLPMLLLASNCVTQKIIMFGDPLQLSPVARVKDLKLSIFDVLGISSAFRRGEMHPKATMLDTQYRCHAEIAMLTSKLFYGGLLKNGREVVSGKKAMYIKNTHGLGGNFKSENGSFVNERHQRIVIEQVRSALQKGQRSIGVISPFRAQADGIKALYDLELARDYPDADFKSATIHSFQGQEKDIVIFDFTFGYSPRGINLPQSLLGDIESDASKLLNVATTRAKDFFVLVCDLQYTHKVAQTLPNYEDQIMVKWLKEIESIAFAKDVVKESVQTIAA